MKRTLIFFSLILIAMLWVTTWASLQESVIVGGAKIINEPWGIATLFDTYFAFFTFYFWLCFKEVSNLKRGVWFILIVFLGNIAMAGYMLYEVYRLRDRFTFERLLIEKKSSS